MSSGVICYERTDVSIDESGMAMAPEHRAQYATLLGVVNFRLLLRGVHRFAGDPMASTAILGRRFHRAHLLHIDRESSQLRDVEERLEGRNPE